MCRDVLYADLLLQNKKRHYRRKKDEEEKAEQEALKPTVGELNVKQVASAEDELDSELLQKKKDESHLNSEHDEGL